MIIGTLIGLLYLLCGFITLTLHAYFDLPATPPEDKFDEGATPFVFFLWPLSVVMWVFVGVIVLPMIYADKLREIRARRKLAELEKVKHPVDVKKAI